MPDDKPATTEPTGAPAAAPAPAPRAAASTPTPPLGTTINLGKAWGVTKDLLTILVIPGFLWVVKLEVGNAQRDLQIEALKDDITELKGDLKEAQDIEDGVQANALKLATLEGKLDTANGRLHEITTLLRSQ